MAGSTRGTATARTSDNFKAGGLAENGVVKRPSQPCGERPHDPPALAPRRACPVVGRAEFAAHRRSHHASEMAHSSLCALCRTQAGGRARRHVQQTLAAYSREPSSRVIVGVSASTVETLGMWRSRSSARLPIFEKSPSFCRARAGGGGMAAVSACVRCAPRRCRRACRAHRNRSRWHGGGPRSAHHGRLQEAPRPVPGKPEPRRGSRQQQRRQSRPGPPRHRFFRFCGPRSIF